MGAQCTIPPQREHTLIPKADGASHRALPSPRLLLPLNLDAGHSRRAWCCRSPRTHVSPCDHIAVPSSLQSDSLLRVEGVCCSSSMLAEPTRPPHSARSHAQTRVTCWLVDRRTVLGVTAVSLNESRAGWSRFSGSPAPAGSWVVPFPCPPRFSGSPTPAGSWVVPFPCAHRISVRVQRHRRQWPVPAFSGVAPFCVLGCRSRSFVVLVFS